MCVWWGVDVLPIEILNSLRDRCHVQEYITLVVRAVRPSREAERLHSIGINTPHSMLVGDYFGGGRTGATYIGGVNGIDSVRGV